MAPTYFKARNNQHDPNTLKRRVVGQAWPKPSLEHENGQHALKTCNWPSMAQTYFKVKKKPTWLQSVANLRFYI